MGQLAALVPKPRGNLTRFHGVFAPNSKYRVQVTPARRGKGSQPKAPDEEQDRTSAERRAAMTWAQRLKRVFRVVISKGHAVRRSLARAYGLESLQERGCPDGDPWARMFDFAVADRESNVSDLVPYWIFEVEGGARVERRIPTVPFSREVEQLTRLRPRPL